MKGCASTWNPGHAGEIIFIGIIAERAINARTADEALQVLAEERSQAKGHLVTKFEAASDNFGVKG